MSNPDKRRVHVAEIKKNYKDKVHVSTYLRRTFRQDGKVKHETVANISDLPDDLLAVIKNRLATGQPPARCQNCFAECGVWNIRKHHSVASVPGERVVISWNMSKKPFAVLSNESSSVCSNRA